MGSKENKDDFSMNENQIVSEIASQAETGTVNKSQSAVEFVDLASEEDKIPDTAKQESQTIADNTTYIEGGHTFIVFKKENVLHEKKALKKKISGTSDHSLKQKQREPKNATLAVPSTSSATKKKESESEKSMSTRRSHNDTKKISVKTKKKSAISQISLQNPKYKNTGKRSNDTVFGINRNIPNLYGNKPKFSRRESKENLTRTPHIRVVTNFDEQSNDKVQSTAFKTISLKDYESYEGILNQFETSNSRAPYQNAGNKRVENWSNAFLNVEKETVCSSETSENRLSLHKDRNVNSMPYGSEFHLVEENEGNHKNEESSTLEAEAASSREYIFKGIESDGRENQKNVVEICKPSGEHGKECLEDYPNDNFESKEKTSVEQGNINLSEMSSLVFQNYASYETMLQNKFKRSKYYSEDEYWLSYQESKSTKENPRELLNSNDHSKAVVPTKDENCKNTTDPQALLVKSQIKNVEPKFLLPSDAESNSSVKQNCSNQLSSKALMNIGASAPAVKTNNSKLQYHQQVSDKAVALKKNILKNDALTSGTNFKSNVLKVGKKNNFEQKSVSHPEALNVMASNGSSRKNSKMINLNKIQGRKKNPQNTGYKNMFQHRNFFHKTPTSGVTEVGCINKRNFVNMMKYCPKAESRNKGNDIRTYSRNNKPRTNDVKTEVFSKCFQTTSSVKKIIADKNLANKDQRKNCHNVLNLEVTHPSNLNEKKSNCAASCVINKMELENRTSTEIKQSFITGTKSKNCFVTEDSNEKGGSWGSSRSSLGTSKLEKHSDSDSRLQSRYGEEYGKSSSLIDGWGRAQDKFKEINKSERKIFNENYSDHWQIYRKKFQEKYGCQENELGFQNKPSTSFSSEDKSYNSRNNKKHEPYEICTLQNSRKSDIAINPNSKNVIGKTANSRCGRIPISLNKGKVFEKDQIVCKTRINNVDEKGANIRHEKTHHLLKKGTIFEKNRILNKTKNDNINEKSARLRHERTNHLLKKGTIFEKDRLLGKTENAKVNEKIANLNHEKQRSLEKVAAFKKDQTSNKTGRVKFMERCVDLKSEGPQHSLKKVAIFDRNRITNKSEGKNRVENELSTDKFIEMRSFPKCKISGQHLTNNIQNKYSKIMSSKTSEQVGSFNLKKTVKDQFCEHRKTNEKPQVCKKHCTYETKLQTANSSQQKIEQNKKFSLMNSEKNIDEGYLSVLPKKTSGNVSIYHDEKLSQLSSDHQSVGNKEDSRINGLCDVKRIQLTHHQYSNNLEVDIALRNKRNDDMQLYEKHVTKLKGNSQSTYLKKIQQLEVGARYDQDRGSPKLTSNFNENENLKISNQDTLIYSNISKREKFVSEIDKYTVCKGNFYCHGAIEEQHKRNQLNSTCSIMEYEQKRHLSLSFPLTVSCESGSASMNYFSNRKSPTSLHKCPNLQCTSCYADFFPTSDYHLHLTKCGEVLNSSLKRSNNTEDNMSSPLDLSIKFDEEASPLDLTKNRVEPASVAHDESVEDSRAETF